MRSLHERPGAVLEQRDALRGEERVEELAVVLVLGRVDLQRDERPDLADLHGLEARSENTSGWWSTSCTSASPPTMTHVHVLHVHRRDRRRAAA